MPIPTVRVGGTAVLCHLPNLHKRWGGGLRFYPAGREGQRFEKKSPKTSHNHHYPTIPPSHPIQMVFCRFLLGVTPPPRGRARLCVHYALPKRPRRRLLGTASLRTRRMLRPGPRDTQISLRRELLASFFLQGVPPSPPFPTSVV